MSTPTLAPEDSLRLAVLLAGEVHAVRIDEGRLELMALTPRGEARIALHPDTRPERYLMRVREVLAGHAMGSPGGYPVHLRRWTRSGHASPRSLAALLRLGEPEAVTAVALSPDLTHELAQRAWWALPAHDLARHMLGHAAVRSGELGPVLARHLMEHLPFEEDADAARASVEAVAAAGLLDDAMRSRLWRSAQNRPHLLIGWLAHARHTLPHGQALDTPGAVARAAAEGHPGAQALQQWRSAAGQGQLHALWLALDKPPTHDAVYRSLDLCRDLFGGSGVPASGSHAPGETVCGDPGTEGLGTLGRAMAALAQVDHRLAEPVLSRTTSVGPLMRRHLAPVIAPVLDHLKTLRSPT